MNLSIAIVVAVYSSQADRESYKSFPVLSFPALFVLLEVTAAVVVWFVRKRR